MTIPQIFKRFFSRSISRQKNTETDISKAIERYEQIGKATNDAVWEWNLQDNTKWGNDSLYRLYGLDRETDNLDDLEPYAHTHPDDVAKLKATMEDAFLSKENSVEMEFRFRMPDNSYRTFLDRAFISYDSDGKPVKIIGAMQDISERKRTEDAIRESEERYRTLVEQATDAIFIITTEGRLMTINDSGCKLSGYTHEELMQMTLNDVIFKEDLVKDPFRFDELAKGHTVRNERRLKRKDGIAIEVEITAKLLTNGDILVFGRDISDRKMAETQIAESEQRLIRAEKMGNLGHGVYDFKKDKMTLSAGLYNIFGVSPDSFSHSLEGLQSVIHPGDKTIQEKALETLLFNGEVEVEFRIQRPDGEIRNVQFKTVITKNSKGEFINSFTTAIDVTESKKAEGKIRSYNNQLKQLAANLQNIREEERTRIGREIHDELGQWLTVLKMEISRVSKIKNDEAKLNEAIEEMLSQVDGCIQSSRKISTDLRPTLIDDLGLIAALEWQAEEFEKRSGIRSEFNTGIDDLDIPPDYTIAIFRIFQESLTNVARHSGANTAKSEFYVDEGNIILKIIDNGKGFDTTNLDSRKTLGLIGMQERTLLMNGSYEIRSAPGKGTEIRVVIPLPLDE